jgi:hypothetical protein
MTLAPPTLEQIKSGRTQTGCDINVVVLAREIIALREQVRADSVEIREWLVRLEGALESAPARGEANSAGDATDQPNVGGSSLGWRSNYSEQVADARRERDEVIRQYRDQVARDREQRDALQQQLAESRAALAKYGRHGYGCAFQQSDANPCTCGLADALAATTPTAGGPDA